MGGVFGELAEPRMAEGEGETAPRQATRWWSDRGLIIRDDGPLVENGGVKKMRHRLWAGLVSAGLVCAGSAAHGQHSPASASCPPVRDSQGNLVPNLRCAADTPTAPASQRFPYPGEAPPAGTPLPAASECLRAERPTPVLAPRKATVLGAIVGGAFLVLSLFLNGQS